MGEWAELVSALCALGSLAYGIFGFFYDRHKKLVERIDRIATEVRYIEKSTNHPIRPFYDGEL